MGKKIDETKAIHPIGQFLHDEDLLTEEWQKFSLTFSAKKQDGHIIFTNTCLECSPLLRQAHAEESKQFNKYLGKINGK